MTRPAAALAAALSLGLPLAARADQPAAPPPACACPAAPDQAELREAMGTLTREVSKLRDAMGGPFDGINGLRREVEGLRRDLDGLKREIDELTRAVERSHR